MIQKFIVVILRIILCPRIKQCAVIHCKIVVVIWFKGCSRLFRPFFSPTFEILPMGSWFDEIGSWCLRFTCLRKNEILIIIIQFLSYVYGLLMYLYAASEIEQERNKNTSTTKLILHTCGNTKIWPYYIHYKNKSSHSYIEVWIIVWIIISSETTKTKTTVEEKMTTH